MSADKQTSPSAFMAHLTMNNTAKLKSNTPKFSERLYFFPPRSHFFSPRSASCHFSKRIAKSQLPLPLFPAKKYAEKPWKKRGKTGWQHPAFSPTNFPIISPKFSLFFAHFSPHIHPLFYMLNRFPHPCRKLLYRTIATTDEQRQCTLF